MANKRLIDVDNAISHYKALANIEWNKRVSPVSWADAYDEFVEYLEEAPTVDAVEVVRCKDCKSYVNRECKNLIRHMTNPCSIYTLPNDFCSYGERR